MTNPTSNFGWQMPMPTDLVTDLPADFEVFGQAVDNTMATMVAKTIVDAKGDLLAATGADALARLAVGSNDSVLTADSSTATGLKWASAPPSGKVLQVVQATYSTATSITGTTFADTGLTATITPTSATSKILILISQPTWSTPLYGTPSVITGKGKIVRASTDIYANNIVLQFGYGTANGNMQIATTWSVNYLDSPATTSATTYKTQMAGADATDLVQPQRSSSTSTIILLEIGA